MVKTQVGKRGGRPSIFGSCEGGDRIQGVLTPTGSDKFNSARRRLARLVGKEPAQISDANTVEYLALGETAALAVIRKHERIKSEAK